MHHVATFSKLVTFGLISLSLVLTGCASTTSPSPTAIPPTIAPTDVAPTEMLLVTDTSVPMSFEAATYKDESAGFELDYPSFWTADPPQVGGDRGYFAQLTSWERTPGELPEDIPDGGTILSVNVLLWDPKNALDAYIDVRKQAWAASGFEILSEEEWTLAGEWRAFQFRIQTPEDESFFLITTIGERYLVLSGSGDLDLLAEIARTLRPLGMTP
jgi:hypothetical protein